MTGRWIRGRRDVAKRVGRSAQHYPASLWQQQIAIGNGNRLPM